MAVLNETGFERHGATKYNIEVAEAIEERLKEYVEQERGYLFDHEIAQVLIGERALEAMPESFRESMVEHAVETMNLGQIAKYLRKALGFPMATLFTDRYVTEFRSKGKLPDPEDVSPRFKSCLLAGGRDHAATGIVVDDPVMFDISKGRSGAKVRGQSESATSELVAARTAETSFPIARAEFTRAGATIRTGLAGMSKRLRGKGQRALPAKRGH